MFDHDRPLFRIRKSSAFVNHTIPKRHNCQDFCITPSRRSSALPLSRTTPWQSRRLSRAIHCLLFHERKTKPPDHRRCRRASAPRQHHGEPREVKRVECCFVLRETPGLDDVAAARCRLLGLGERGHEPSPGSSRPRARRRSAPHVVGPAYAIPRASSAQARPEEHGRLEITEAFASQVLGC